MTRFPPLLAPQNRLLTIAGASAFLIAAIFTAPASLGAAVMESNMPLLDFGGAKGTIWRAQFSNVYYDGIDLGAVTYAIKPAALLGGSVVADLTSGGGALSLKSRVSVSPRGFEMKDARGRFNLASIRRYTFFGAPYQGVAEFSARSLSFSRRRCQAEDVKVSTDMLSGMAKQWSGAAIPLQGVAECRDGKLVLTLSGESSDGAVRINAAVAPDFAYAMDLTAAPKREEIGVALRQFGFEGENAQLSWRAVGKLKGLSS